MPTQGIKQPLVGKDDMPDTRYSCGLVLEGGGMRGLFTSGVLDAFMENGIDFPYIIGTSAGATNGAAFVSRQYGRSHFCNIDLHAIRPYVGLRHWIAGHGVIDMDFLFDEMPRDYYPFDFDTYKESKTRLVAVASDARTGKAAYLEEKEDLDRFTAICRASCSLPILCPMGNVDGRPMVDGGVCDSIPFQRALDDGCRRLVVVLTKDPTYRKSERLKWLPRGVYKDYPALREALIQRNTLYNKQLDDLAQLSRLGTALVIRPQDTHGVGRTTDNRKALEALYADGKQLTEETLRQVREMVVGA